MIPRIIHQIWMQGAESIPVKYQVFQDTWKQNDNSHFQYEFWDARRIESVVAACDHPDWVATYRACTSMIQKVDFAKYVILHTFGGVYMDMDVFSTGGNSLESFLIDMEKNGQEFAVFQHNGPCFTVFVNKLMGLHGNKIINNAVIISGKGNRQLANVVRSCARALEYWEKKWFPRRSRCLVTTGPIMFTNCIRHEPAWETFVHPAFVFEPFTSLETTRLGKKWMELEKKDERMRTEGLMSDMKASVDANRSIGIHVLDLSWLKRDKDDWQVKLRDGFHRYFAI